MKNILWSNIKLFLLSALAATVCLSFLQAREPVKFMSTRSSKVNVRVGPGTYYPISFIFLKQGEPLEIIDQFEFWRQVRDIDKEVGWVHISLLSNKRYVIVRSSLLAKISLFQYPSNKSQVIAYVASGARCVFLNYCYKNWCNVQCKGYKGWLQKPHLWGIDDNEFLGSSLTKLYYRVLTNIW